MGNTVLLATVCAAKDANPGVDFMPLQVEYKEKYASFGRFPGGFTRREGKASDYEILTCRLVDRALRPLFPDDYHAEVFVNVILFSTDGVDMPDALAGLAASSALAVSDIPFNGPISEVRVARVDGQFIINPTFEELKRADIELMVGATLDNIMMVEGEMQEVQEAEMLEAIADRDADVITIECSRSQMELLDVFGDFKYPNEIGPGVYDIHSPRVPSQEEMTNLMKKAISVVPKEQLWVNPDCGLKTRHWPETKAALHAMVDTAKELRNLYK